MRKILFVISIVILQVSCSTINVQVNPDLEVATNDIFYIARYNDDIGLYESIVEVFQESGVDVEVVYDSSSIPFSETPEVSGSGFFISPEIIITNEHVLNDEDSVIYYQNGVKHTAIPVFSSKQNDIAVLRGEVSEEPYFRLLSSSDYSVAIPIFVLGYPLTDILGNEIRVTNGIINSLSGLDGDSNAIQISAPIQPGNSGGPVVTDEYEVVGVASSKLSDAYAIAVTDSIAQNVNFAIKSDLVSFFAAEYLSDKEANYVDSLDEAINATVKIEVGGTKIIPARQYYIDISYNAWWDMFYWTLSKLDIFCRDVSTGKIVAEASFRGNTGRSAKYIAKELAGDLIDKLYGFSSVEENTVK